MSNDKLVSVENRIANESEKNENPSEQIEFFLFLIHCKYKITKKMYIY